MPLKRVPAFWTISSIVLACGMSSADVQARGSKATEKPWASEHVDDLPPNIKRGIIGRERACGNAAAAGHYFSVSIDGGGRRFVSLHFEEFACTNRAAVCDSGGCLHEVYLADGNRHRLVFSVRSRDVKMFAYGGTVGLKVSGEKANSFFRWNGQRFIATLDFHKEH